jgi:DNA-binding transcriptional regulator YdaS (Cro superfamily)
LYYYYNHCIQWGFEMSNETPIAKAVRIAGGQTALARKIGVTQGAVWKWLRGMQKISAEHVISISESTDGQVLPFELRPDLPKLFPHPDGAEV